MNENLNKYFNTGEFAKLCNVKKQTLFHYDDIGIFSPEIKDENGYRYYSYQQFDVFNVISILKEINMPLKEIKIYLDNRTPDGLIGLFEEKIVQVDKEIDDLKRIRSLMETKIALTKKARSIDYSKISIEHLDEDYLILSKSIENVSHKDYLKIISAHMNYCSLNNLNSGYSIGAIIAKENILKGVKDNYSYLYTKLSSPLNIPCIFNKPKGFYCVAFHQGDYREIDSTYRKILSFLSELNLEMGAYSFEDFILDETCVKGYENYVTQISVEILNKKRDV